MDININIDVLIAEIMKSIIEVAARDGKISNDEELIVDNVHQNIKEFRKALKIAWEDKIITVEERELLEEIADKILDNAMETANADGFLTQEEMNLLLAIAMKVKVPKNIVDLKSIL